MIATYIVYMHVAVKLNLKKKVNLSMTHMVYEYEHDCDIHSV